MVTWLSLFTSADFSREISWFKFVLDDMGRLHRLLWIVIIQAVYTVNRYEVIITILTNLNNNQSDIYLLSMSLCYVCMLSQVKLDEDFGKVPMQLKYCEALKFSAIHKSLLLYLQRSENVSRNMICIWHWRLLA